MKHRVVAGLLVLGAFSVTPALGQTVEVGPMVGLAWADMLGNDSNRADTRKGFAVGASASYRVSDAFQVQVDGLYTQKGAGFSTRDGRFDLKTTYIEIPLLARLLFPARADNGTIPYLLAGPAVSIETSCEVQSFGSGGTVLTQDCENSSVPAFQETEAVDVGMVVGGGLNADVGALHSFYVEGRLNVGVRSLDDTSRRLDMRNLSFTLLTGFGFGFGR